MKELICIVCPRGCRLVVDEENGFAVTGNGCARGAEYGRAELTNPMRVLTSTVRCKGGLHPRCPVRTEGEIPRGMIPEIMKALDSVCIHAPAVLGQTVIADVCGTGVDIVTTRAIDKI